MDKDYPIINGVELSDLSKLRFDEIERVTEKYLEMWNQTNNDVTAFNLACLIISDDNLSWFKYFDNRTTEQLKDIITVDDYHSVNEVVNERDYEVRKKYVWILYNRRSRDLDA